MLPELVQSAGAVIAAWGLIELTIAQTAHKFKGLILLLWATIGIVFVVISLDLDQLLSI